MTATPRPSPRWWPLIAIAVLTGVAWAVIARLPHLSQQHYVLDLARLFLVTLALLLIWLLGFSRLRWKTRGLTVGVGVLAVLITAGLFRIRGVSGNLIPILEPRWTSKSWAPVQTNAVKAAAAVIPGAADFPQFLGSNRTAVVEGPKLVTQGLAADPVPLWKHEVGTGWSGFAVAGGIAVTQEQRDSKECVVAYDLLTGRTLWTQSVEARYFTTLAGEGPRATPTIANGRVYAQGATGYLNCLDAATGRVIWSKDILSENQSSVPGWGHSSSPLIVGDLVLVTAGGHKSPSLLAYRIADGSKAWGGPSLGSTYSSPLEVTLAGERQFILFADALHGVDPATGKLLWKQSWPGGHPHIAMPVQVGDSDVIVSSGYGTGSGRFHVQKGEDGKWSTAEVWRSNRMKAKFTNLVLHKNHVYGLDDGIMACADAATGDLKWKDGKYGHGQVLLVAGVLLVMAENGEVVFVDPLPTGLSELGKFRALAGKTWNPPALAGEYLLVRNDLEAACYRLAIRP